MHAWPHLYAPMCVYACACAGSACALPWPTQPRAVVVPSEALLLLPKLIFELHHVNLLPTGHTTCATPRWWYQRMSSVLGQPTLCARPQATFLPCHTSSRWVALGPALSYAQSLWRRAGAPECGLFVFARRGRGASKWAVSFSLRQLDSMRVSRQLCVAGAPALNAQEPPTCRSLRKAVLHDEDPGTSAYATLPRGYCAWPQSLWPKSQMVSHPE